MSSAKSRSPSDSVNVHMIPLLTPMSVLFIIQFIVRQDRKDGVVITSVEKQTQLWKTHFETILNKEAPREVEDIPERDEDLLVNMDPPTANEVKSAIDNMKSGKAPGADGVSAEMLKAGGDVITETLPEIFKEIWEEEEIPVDWKTGLIVKLPKKGKLSLCKNWRGITLLSITSKVFSRVILNRISTALDPMLRKEQAGFSKGRSCGKTHLHPTTGSRTMP